jgi:hypothetical protein
MKTSILAAGLLLLAGSAIPASAHGDEDDNGGRARVQNEDNYDAHGRLHRRINRTHEAAHEEGFESRRQHWRFHQRLRNAHEEAHDGTGQEDREHGERHHRRWWRWYN